MRWKLTRRAVYLQGNKQSGFSWRPIDANDNFNAHQSLAVEVDKLRCRKQSRLALPEVAHTDTAQGPQIRHLTSSLSNPPTPGRAHSPPAPIVSDRISARTCDELHQAAPMTNHTYCFQAMALTLSGLLASQNLVCLFIRRYICNLTRPISCGSRSCRVLECTNLTFASLTNQSHGGPTCDRSFSLAHARSLIVNLSTCSSVCLSVCLSVYLSVHFLVGASSVLV